MCNFAQAMGRGPASQRGCGRFFDIKFGSGMRGGARVGQRDVHPVVAGVASRPGATGFALLGNGG
jgi:hypothetical protein